MRGLLTCMMVVMLVATLVSCGGAEVCNLDCVEFDVEGLAGWMTASDDGLYGDEQAASIASALNEATEDRPDLVDMLQADISDDEENYFIHNGSDHFLETLQTFADTNYPKAEKMFPEMTYEEFYYCSAIGYTVANNGTMTFVIPSDPIDSFEKTTTYTPDFEEVMIQSFCVTYCANKFNYYNVLTFISPEERDMEITLDSVADIDVVVRFQLLIHKYSKYIYDDWYMIKQIEQGRDYNHLGSIERPNYVLTQRLFKILKDAHYLSGSYKGLTDVFNEIASESLSMAYLLGRYEESSFLKTGHIAHASDEQLFYLVKPSGVGISLCHLTMIDEILASSALTNDVVTISFEDINTWRYTNIKTIKTEE